MELLHGRQAARRLFSFVTFVPFCSDCLNETEGNKGNKPTFRRSLREFPLDFRGSRRAVAVPANGSPVRPIWDF